MGTLNVTNRTLAIVDNYPFLRSLNNECIDLIAIDPPFAANETFTSKPRPPISKAEFDEEVALAKAHGAAHNEGIGAGAVGNPGPAAAEPVGVHMFGNQRFQHFPEFVGNLESAGGGIGLGSRASPLGTERLEVFRFAHCASLTTVPDGSSLLA